MTFSKTVRLSIYFANILFSNQIKKMVQKILINAKDIKVLLTETGIENYRIISNYENVNFVLETRAIAQMKGLLILIKSYENTFVKNEYLTIFWVPKGIN